MNRVRRLIYGLTTPLMICLGLGGTQEDTRPTPPPQTPTAKQCGVSWVAGRPVAAKDFDPLVATGVTWIVQTPFGWQRDANSPQIRLVTDGRVLWGETDEGLAATTRLARKHGIRTLLKPHIWLRDRSRGWRGEINMADEADWLAWFADYRRFILHYARFAEAQGIEALCIGTELHRTVVERPDDWRRIIAEVREAYHGKLTYGANWFREYEDVPFWSDLDFIGVHAYFPLADDAEPTLEELTRGWAPYVERFERLQEWHSKPILFTEIGYRSAKSSASAPWEWPKRGEAAEAALDLQARCYEAFFLSVWEKPWCAGVYFWKWYPAHAAAGGPDNTDFTPQNKPAQEVMSAWFRRPQ